MPIINYFKKEITLKIVYFGPALCGKTTNLISINKHYKEGEIGKLITLPTETDRTIFFDLLPVSGGQIEGFNIRYQLFTVPGQVYYNATRKMVLKGADGLVFVADSQANMHDPNLESFANLQENLGEYGRYLEDIPLVFQWNKRDLKDLIPIDELQKELNPADLPAFESEAINGIGVLDTFKAIRDLTAKHIIESLDMERQRSKAKPGSMPQLPKKQTMRKEPIKDITSELEFIDCGNPQVVSYGFIRVPLVLRNKTNDEYYSINLDISLSELTKKEEPPPPADEPKTSKKPKAPSKKKSTFYK